jgi:iron complex transport system ATP-binding protein
MTVELRGVGVSIDGARLLDRIDLRVDQGEWVGLIGPNGAGKSTLLKVVVGAVATDHGRVALDGRPVEQMDRRDRARMVAMVPQRPMIPVEMMVFDYVLLGRTPHLGPLAVESQRDLAVVDECLARLDIEGFARRRLGTLSGGELQRAVLARALAQQAPVLLLDEPTAALDLGHHQQVLELVEEMRRRDGLTVLTALHDLTAAAQFCDRLVLLSRGVIAAEGTPELVINEELISLFFGARVQVLNGPDGVPVVIPRRLRDLENERLGDLEIGRLGD